jgi:Protein of unknown function (DUF3455)
MNRARLALAAVGLAALVAAAAFAVAHAHAQTPSAGAHQQAQAEAAAPAAAVDPRLQVPAGNALGASLSASGVQVYQCAAGSWTFLEPNATLGSQGRTTALHTRGPIWISTVDGSAVSAAAVPGASASHPGAVPELLLKATANLGDGVFGKVTFVQRLRTHGGVAPAGSCTTGAQVGVPYTADYLFYVPSAGR